MTRSSGSHSRSGATAAWRCWACRISQSRSTRSRPLARRTCGRSCPGRGSRTRTVTSSIPAGSARSASRGCGRRWYADRRVWCPTSVPRLPRVPTRTRGGMRSCPIWSGSKCRCSYAAASRTRTCTREGRSGPSARSRPRSATSTRTAAASGRPSTATRRRRHSSPFSRHICRMLRTLCRACAWRCGSGATTCSRSATRTDGPRLARPARST